jgi:CheY-like chemotaxis protein
MRILVVEDNKVQATAFSMKLKAQGYEVLLAEDGSEAISIARRVKLDLIMLDIMFPPDVAHGGGVGWDGFLILTWLRRVEQAKDVPVIFISGADPKKYEQRALAEGAVKFFRKPLEGDELLAAVREILNPGKPDGPERKQVLFVDDEGDWRLVVSSYLEEAGFHVVTAKDATEALRRRETLELDGIILDLNLGGENGLLMMEFLKQKYPGVPILVYTGMEFEPAAAQWILQQGATQYLRKGSMAELCDTLRKMVNQEVDRSGASAGANEQHFEKSHA